MECMLKKFGYVFDIIAFSHFIYAKMLYTFMQIFYKQG